MYLAGGARIRVIIGCRGDDDGDDHDDGFDLSLLNAANVRHSRIRARIPGLDMIIRFSRGNVIALAGSRARFLLPSLALFAPFQGQAGS